MRSSAAHWLSACFTAASPCWRCSASNVGDRLGLYRALAQDGPSTAAHLARSAGIHERYAREWLEQQAVAGLIEVKTESTDADKRRYGLAPGHAEVLLNPDSLNYLVPIVWAIPGL